MDEKGSLPVPGGFDEREKIDFTGLGCCLAPRDYYYIHFIRIYMMLYGRKEVPVGDGSRPWVRSASLGASYLFEAKNRLIFLILTEHT